MLYGGLNLELSVRDTSGFTGALGIVAAFGRADRALTAELKRIIRRGAILTRDVTRRLAPRRTGFMANRVTIWIDPTGLASEVGWQADDFLNVGKAFYPVFVELGTRKMAAQPSLGPAHRYAQPIIRQEMRAAVRTTVARLQRQRR